MKVRDHLGMYSRKGYVNGSDAYLRGLTVINDNTPDTSFKSVVKAIEAHPELYFKKPK